MQHLCKECRHGEAVSILERTNQPIDGKDVRQGRSARIEGWRQALTATAGPPVVDDRDRTHRTGSWLAWQFGQTKLAEQVRTRVVAAHETVVRQQALGNQSRGIAQEIEQV